MLSQCIAVRTVAHQHQQRRGKPRQYQRHGLQQMHLALVMHQATDRHDHARSGIEAEFATQGGGRVGACAACIGGGVDAISEHQRTRRIEAEIRAQRLLDLRRHRDAAPRAARQGTVQAPAQPGARIAAPARAWQQAETVKSDDDRHPAPATGGQREHRGIGDMGMQDVDILTAQQARQTPQHARDIGDKPWQPHNAPAAQAETEHRHPGAFERRTQRAIAQTTYCRRNAMARQAHGQILHRALGTADAQRLDEMQHARWLHGAGVLTVRAVTGDIPRYSYSHRHRDQCRHPPPCWG